jgi:hypothetical protein
MVRKVLTQVKKPRDRNLSIQNYQYAMAGRKILISLVPIFIIIFTIGYTLYLDTDKTFPQQNNKTTSINFSENYNNEIENLSRDNESKYFLHENIIATIFWAGEGESYDNDYITNVESAWDEKWMEHFGGIDDPDKRKGYGPADFKPKENPFYFALPYNDFNDNGERRDNAKNIIYWGDEKKWGGDESMLKNRWIKITKGEAVAYAQWEDSGPFLYNDSEYVFGEARPKNTFLEKAGLDISPAVADYLNIKGSGVVNWTFIDFLSVPDGHWSETITTSQIHWE